jgi:serine/threonine protein phosphatase PrpC
MKLQLIFGHKSDLGRERDNMEDAYLIRSNQLDSGVKSKGALFIVADGVGGNKSGEIASNMAANTAVEKYYSSQLQDPVTALSQALINTNAVVYQQSRTLGNENMATTIVCAVIHHGKLTVAHIGDSRAYLFRNGKLTQITQDHSWIHDQVSRGILTLEQAEKSPYRNVINRSIGNKPEVEPEVHEHGELQDGDRILLCTDGLYDGVSDAQMIQVLASYAPQDACEVFVDMANKAGGTDNITVIVIEIHTAETSSTTSQRKDEEQTVLLTADDLEDDQTDEHTRLHSVISPPESELVVEKVNTTGIPLPAASKRIEAIPLQENHVKNRAQDLEKVLGSEPLPWESPEEPVGSQADSNPTAQTKKENIRDVRQWDVVISYNWPGVCVAMNRAKSFELPDGRKMVLSLNIAENDVHENFPTRFGLIVDLDGTKYEEYVVGKGIDTIDKKIRKIVDGKHHLIFNKGDLIKITNDDPYVFAEVKDFDYAEPPEYKGKSFIAFKKLDVIFKIQLKS